MNNPVAPVVTDKMLSKALDVYNKTNCDEGKTQDDAMRAAITAALEASSEIERLRAAAEDLVSLCHADVRMNGTTYQPMPYRSAFTKAVERLIEALKGPTP